MEQIGTSKKFMKSRTTIRLPCVPAFDELKHEAAFKSKSWDISTVHGEKKFKILQVFKSSISIYNKNWSLKQHIAAVYKGKEFGAQYVNSQSWLSHHVSTVHEEKKLFECTVCHGSFAS